MTIAGVQRICVTGPESTGKTTLAQQLAALLECEWVPEAARLYAERGSRELTVDDVLPIAREHIALADAALARAIRDERKAIVFDTDLVSTVIYGRHYYGFTSSWLNAEEVQRRADSYLLCEPDLPWVPDGIRDQPMATRALLSAFAEELEHLGAAVHLITGLGDERLRVAVQALA